jgi:3'(2'), 5'-bisphosphate nucleotidase
MTSRPTPEELESDLAFARLAALRAGERALHLRALERWEDAALADVGDQACDGFLQGLLLGRYPEDGVLSEETRDSRERLERYRTWIVDPLDGTREFSELRDDWAVHVALTLDGRCAVAAVALPAQGRLLWGLALSGAERAGLEGPGELSRGEEPGEDPPRIACSRSHTPEWMERFRSEIGGGPLLRSGSVGNKVAALLLGRADVYVHRKGLKEWDTCAPETVARALGWTVCRLRGEEHAYNRPDPQNHELVVCRPAWKERVLAALQRSGALA